ncbi:MAG: M48 family metalloprotease [Desulfamplus sp.]|nr:M48 family metalloprotease [Desulfamplus sp.]
MNLKSILIKFKSAVVIFISITFLNPLFFGSSSTNLAFAISISQERELAVEFMEAIERQGKVIKDTMVRSLVTDIGEQILEAVPPQPLRYSFYVVDEEQFNAFAGPGANIFVHRGLITSLDTLDELAGIIGHEIAHSSCRHISDMVDRSKIMSIGTLAGILAGVLVGSSGGVRGGTDLGQALMVGSLAAGQTVMLAYSREHETEADQKGLVYLTQSGFDPKGLLTGLEKIRSRDWFGSETIPDYLKTHPGSTERIVNIQSWIESRKEQGGKSKNGKDLQKNSIDLFRFEMVKYRLAGMYGDQDESEKMLLATLSKEPNSAPAHYGMALLMERKDRVDESIKHLQKALEINPFDPHTLVAMAKMKIVKGEHKQAIEIIEGLGTLEEKDVEVEALFYLSKAQLALGMGDVAEKGFEKVIDKYGDSFPKAYYHLAAIKGKSDKIGKDAGGLSHYYLGLYYYEMKNLKGAKFHLIKSLEMLSDDDKKQHAHLILMKSKIRESEDRRRGR